MAESTITKLATGIVHHDTSPINEYYFKRSKVTGHKMHNVATRQPCGAVSSRDNTTAHDCLIQGDRVVGVSYALYRVPSL